MNIVKLSPIVVVATILVVAACNDSTSPSLYDVATVDAEVASVSGDALAVSIVSMVDNEVLGGLPGLVGPTANALSVTRARTCYDANEVVVNGCTPLSSVRRIVTTGTAEGSRTVTHTPSGGTARTFTGVVHRAFSDTLRRIFGGNTQPPLETSRSHSGVATGHDTTTFEQGELSRKVAEATVDTVKAVTWNLPRTSNPFPVSGSVVRVDTVHVTLTSGTRTESREFVRRIQVDFPADGQGNVVLTINAKTCNLNLVTHAVSNCQ